MTTLTIGRFSMSDGPSAIRHDGDFLELELQIDAATTSTPAEAKVKRQQLLGMVDNPDEGAFPLTFSDDSDLDGFYSVLSVQCEPFEMFLNNGTMAVSVSLRRVANGYQNPTIETTVVSRLATNSHSVLSTTDYAVAGAYVPAGYTDSLDFTGLTGTLTQAITLADASSAEVVLLADSNTSGYWSLFGDPAEHYSQPACTLEYKLGSTWYQAVGRQLLNGVPWRINNGIIRIGDDGGSGLLVEVADSGAWAGSTRINGQEGNTPFSYVLGANAGPFVLRNGPDMCIVKVQGTYGVYNTFTVWRGGTIAMVQTNGTTVASKPGLKFASTTACTAVTGGIRATSNDANGNRLVILCRAAVTTDLTNGYVTPTVSTFSSVMSVGYNLGATGSGLFSEAGQLGQLCAPPQFRQRIAAR